MKLKVFKQCISVMLVGIYLLTTAATSYAQVLAAPQPAMIGLSQPFSPVMLQGVKVNPNNPLQFDFIVDPGALESDKIEQESQKLVKYFLASLAIPESDLWVNLSPYEEDRIIEQSFGQTEMGRDLLVQDYLLKQLTSSLLHPDSVYGQSFWNDVYSAAYKKYGTTDIPVDTFHKVWITPASAEVYEGDGVAYVIDSKLTVMLEQDYLANKNNNLNIDQTTGVALTTEVMREVIIPAIEEEVNEGSHFSQLRQIYNSFILATWYKKKMQNGLLNQVYADEQKIAGVNHDDPVAAQEIWQDYVKTFHDGIYNFIKEEYDLWTDETIPRKYFSGGMKLDEAMISYTNNKSKIKQIVNGLAGGLMMVSMLLTPLNEVKADQEIGLKSQQIQKEDIFTLEGKYRENLATAKVDSNAPSLTVVYERELNIKALEKIVLESKDKNLRGQALYHIRKIHYGNLDMIRSNVSDQLVEKISWLDLPIVEEIIQEFNLTSQMQSSSGVSFERQQYFDFNAQLKVEDAKVFLLVLAADSDNKQEFEHKVEELLKLGLVRVLSFEPSVRDVLIENRLRHERNILRKKEGLMVETDKRPLAIIVTSMNDYNGAFSYDSSNHAVYFREIKDVSNFINQQKEIKGEKVWGSLGQLIDLGYEVLYFDVKTMEEAMQRINEGATFKPAHHIKIGAHGTPVSMEFNKSIKIDEIKENIDKWKKLVMGSVNADTDVLCVSCSTGDVEVKDNVIDVLQNIFSEATVIGPTKDIFGHIYDPTKKFGEGRIQFFFKDRPGMPAYIPKKGGIIYNKDKDEEGKFGEEGSVIKGEELKKDQAMNSEVGGIDLNSSFMDFAVTSDDGSIEFNFSSEYIEQIKSNLIGITPVIINIQPIISLPIFLGLKDSDDDIQVAQS